VFDVITVNLPVAELYKILLCEWKKRGASIAIAEMQTATSM